MDRFLGRTLNPNTLVWEHADGSGVPFTEEQRQEILAESESGDGGAIRALMLKWGWEKKYREMHPEKFTR